MAKSAAHTRAWRHADADTRRQLIVQTALHILDDRGLDAVTMRRVASHIGLGAMTLYTYVDDQADLWQHMVRCGFDQLHAQCQASSTLASDESWRGGARAYIRFALDHPNLYKLMFDTPAAPTADPSLHPDQQVLTGGLKPLLEKVRHRLASKNLPPDRLNRQALTEAGRFWIGLHGLAMLAIAGRLDSLQGDINTILDDLLPHIAPS